MKLKAYLPIYRQKFIFIGIKKMSFTTGLLELNSKERVIGEVVLDQYATEKLKRRVCKMPDGEYFASMLFFDALSNSALHSKHNLSFSNICKRSVLVLNCNFSDPSSNISHKYPQIILGLKTEWSMKEINIFKRLFREYIAIHSPLFPPGLFNSLKNDRDIQSKAKLDGNEVNIELINSYLEVLEEIKDNTSEKSILTETNMQINFNTFIFNKANLSQAENNLLSKHPEVKKDESLFVFCHHENLWDKLALHFTQEEMDKIKVMLTDINKGYSTISGLTVMNTAPHGVAYSPAPSWLEIKIEIDKVNIGYKKH